MRTGTYSRAPAFAYIAAPLLDDMRVAFVEHAEVAPGETVLEKAHFKLSYRRHEWTTHGMS